jgi:hypothetical protein
VGEIIKDKFDYVLKHYGHDVILRKDREGIITWERHTTRNRYPSVRGVPQVRDERDEGLVHLVDMIFYFRAEAQPREGDRIYEGDVRYNELDNAIPHRGRGGIVIYYTAGCTRDVPN